ncbi:competence type IV pilus major pilin ComGC [Pallidibacillus pasinlerensis]|uniref:ComG operon protein 3 n=1 Tax=Pallidibacillus pasinlerensis TaxID=2703818 RepID=A0ABX0A3B9_9BACI|nr:competence type IV pilus major pilin ComGC [Pallidibacillus pasinlerensis]NCU17876.1 prepilin-type N-terminal cleavage/methylation domain-containing protein [Pallidibacillus pasinlerensis]
MRNEKGFTLIEMMIVLFVISILLLITIPNVTKNQSSITEKGCEGLVNMVQAQIQAYLIDYGATPTIEELVSKNYLEENPKCPNGSSVQIVNGKATVQ